MPSSKEKEEKVNIKLEALVASKRKLQVGSYITCVAYATLSCVQSTIYKRGHLLLR